MIIFDTKPFNIANCLHSSEELSQGVTSASFTINRAIQFSTM